MKIIGTSGDRNVIAYMSKDELAQLNGVSNAYGESARYGNWAPGTEVDVGSLYAEATEAAQWLKCFRADIEDNAKRLARLLEKISPKPKPQPPAPPSVP